MEKNIENLKKLRLILGIKQQDFAKGVGVSRAHYCNVENKRFIPDDCYILNIYNNALKTYSSEIEEKIKEFEEQLDILEIK